MSAIAIIPARGGSKRILRKNIKAFNGAPIISYSIKAAIESGLFDEVMVSTDDAEIAEVALEYGAVIPFMRSATTSDDYATTSDVLIEVLNLYKGKSKEYDYTACIYPTAPFISATKLKEAFDLLNKSNSQSVFPVVKYSYPIQRSLKIDDDIISMNWPEFISSRSQDLRPAYHDSGQFYIAVTNRFLEQKTMFMEKSTAIIVSEMEVQDIDNETDWQIAEFKFEILKKSLSGSALFHRH